MVKSVIFTVLLISKPITMRKITEAVVSAFNDNRNFKRGNDKVTVSTTPDGSTTETRMFLHDNLIATKITAKGKTRVDITNAGWESNTTKERLNALEGVSIHQKNFEWFLNDEPWDGRWIQIK